MGGPRDASGTPRSAGASGAVAGGGLSERVAQGISSVVVGVTSRPPGPIPVDAKDPHGAPDPLRTPTVDEGQMSQPSGLRRAMPSTSTGSVRRLGKDRGMRLPAPVPNGLRPMPPTCATI